MNTNCAKAFTAMCLGSFLTPWALSAAETANDDQYLSWPVYSGQDLELDATPRQANFRLWSPKAEAVRLMIYPTDRNSKAIETVDMKASENGTWTASLAGN